MTARACCSCGKVDGEAILLEDDILVCMLCWSLIPTAQRVWMQLAASYIRSVEIDDDGDAGSSMPWENN
jgi:hypothetical protein